MVSDMPTIPEFYRGSKILITGGSGFMGKVLIEKLLRSCPDVHTLYLLLRAKRNTEPSSRIKEITDQPLFDRIRQDSPEQFNKLVAVSGDVTQLGLGLCERDRLMLQEEVSVVFHSAASVRFDDLIRDAIFINVRGTREVVELALGMKHLKVMLHVSTTYCNCDKPEVLEQIYPAPGDWRAMIQLAEKEDDLMLNCMTSKIIGTHPNTYTYTKALGEHVINDYSHRLPLVIVRPSVVVASNEEPIPGWLDNLYGPFAIVLAQGKGMWTSMLASPDVCGDYVPVDVAIKAIIFIALHRACSRNEMTLPVYNACSMTAGKFTSKRLVDQAQTLVTGPLPLEDALWYPTMTVTGCWWHYYFKTILFQVIPAILLDAVLKMKGRKPMMLKIQRRGYMAIHAIYVFATTRVDFLNDNFIRLSFEMQESDLKEFAYNKAKLPFEDIVFINIKGLKEYVLKEPLSGIPKAQSHIRRLYWLHQVTKALFYMAVIWAFVSCPLVQAMFTSHEVITFSTIHST